MRSCWISRGGLPGRYAGRAALLVALLVALASCRRSGLSSCTALVEAKKYQQAVARCEQVYAAEGEPRAGAGAAQAHYYLGHAEQVFAWLKRLAGTDGERGVWSLAAAIHWERGEMADAERAYRRDVELMRAAGEARGMAAP